MAECFVEEYWFLHSKIIDNDFEKVFQPFATGVFFHPHRIDSLLFSNECIDSYSVKAARDLVAIHRTESFRFDPQWKGLCTWHGPSSWS